MLSDLALVPYAEAMLVPLPEGVEPIVVASAADNIADGWRAVAPALAEHPAAQVLIVGGRVQSISLYAIDAALALGASSVTYVDTDAGRCAVAQKLGATVVVQGEPERSLGAFPVTVDGTGTPEGLVATLRLTDWGGRCTSLGQLAPSGSLPLFELYTRGVHLHIGRAMARPAIPAILDLVAAGRLRPHLVTSATVAWDDAPQALLEPAIKLVVHRP
jgi:alcohol dehydrogenase